MHYHPDVPNARNCSPFCQANATDRAYYEKHHHYAEEAPVDGCGACLDLKHAMEQKMQEQEERLYLLMRR